jgi:hypothetical protein
MVIKYSNIFNYKTLQNLTQIGIFGLKTNHLVTLLYTNAVLKLYTNAVLKFNPDNVLQVPTYAF